MAERPHGASTPFSVQFVAAGVISPSIESELGSAFEYYQPHTTVSFLKNQGV